MAIIDERNPLRIGLVASLGITLDSFFLKIVETWEAEGHSVFAAAGTSSSIQNTTILSGLTRQPAVRNAIAIPQIRNWVKSRGLDVVLTNTATASALVRMARLRVPVVYFCHGLHWNSPGLWNLGARLLESVLLSRTAAVVTINSDDEMWFRTRREVRPLLRLRAGVGLDLDEYPRTARDPSSPTLCWVGEFTKRKRPEEALKVAAELRKCNHTFLIYMLGDGPRSGEIRQRIKDGGLEGSIRLVGRVPAEPYMRDAAAVIHTARWEGMPRVLLEAAVLGRPAIAYDVKGVRDAPGITTVPDGRPDASKYNQQIKHFTKTN